MICLNCGRQLPDGAKLCQCERPHEQYLRQEQQMSATQIQKSYLRLQTQKPIVERTVSTDVPAGVLYKPGSEPEKIKVRLDRLFENGFSIPDKVIVGLNKNHKKWGETVTELYRLLGYPDNNSFLTAYGYTNGTGDSGKPSRSRWLISEELKRRYPMALDPALIV